MRKTILKCIFVSDLVLEKWTNSGLKKPMVDLNMVKKRGLRYSVRKNILQKVEL